MAPVPILAVAAVLAGVALFALLMDFVKIPVLRRLGIDQPPVG
jgi:hypothetical protein